MLSETCRPEDLKEKSIRSTLKTFLKNYDLSLQSFVLKWPLTEDTDVWSEQINKVTQILMDTASLCLSPHPHHRSVTYLSRTIARCVWWQCDITAPLQASNGGEKKKNFTKVISLSSDQHFTLVIDISIQQKIFVFVITVIIYFFLFVLL